MSFKHDTKCAVGKMVSTGRLTRPTHASKDRLSYFDQGSFLANIAAWGVIGIAVGCSRAVVAGAVVVALDSYELRDVSQAVMSSEGGKPGCWSRRTLVKSEELFLVVNLAVGLENRETQREAEPSIYTLNKLTPACTFCSLLRKV
ncbi:conserved hypothetical protein [Uncinocarpus reesii 1704]|uniref:Uncharacterized protein n=1 Tax=Uncinocarpus reesii (strain UAMH 1704) TaxID=336963 RepID=C4JE86_UNCRE|nr:uncharacterized protein UREG_00510 [Uncinocarpus reesii 1704]EEP75664.1 conserved hypothetical protein [Uncinocarpus reesii 1704]